MTDEFLEVQKPLMPNFIHVGGLEPENEKDSQMLDEVGRNKSILEIFCYTNLVYVWIDI